MIFSKRFSTITPYISTMFLGLELVLIAQGNTQLTSSIFINSLIKFRFIFYFVIHTCTTVNQLALVVLSAFLATNVSANLFSVLLHITTTQQMCFNFIRYFAEPNCYYITNSYASFQNNFDRVVSVILSFAASHTTTMTLTSISAFPMTMIQQLSSGLISNQILSDISLQVYDRVSTTIQYVLRIVVLHNGSVVGLFWNFTLLCHLLNVTVITPIIYFLCKLNYLEVAQTFSKFVIFILMASLKFAGTLCYYPLMILSWLSFIFLKYLVIKFLWLVDFLVVHAGDPIFDDFIKPYVVPAVVYVVRSTYYVFSFPAKYFCCYFLPTISSAVCAVMKSCVGVAVFLVHGVLNMHYSAQLLSIICVMWLITAHVCFRQCRTIDRYLLLISFPFYLGLVYVSSYRIEIFQFKVVIPLILTVLIFWMMRIIATHEFQVSIKTNSTLIDQKSKPKICSHILKFFVFYIVIAEFFRWIICPMTLMVVFNFVFLIFLQGHVRYMIFFPIILWVSLKLSLIINLQLMNNKIYRMMKFFTGCKCHDGEEVGFMVVQNHDHHVRGAIGMKAIIVTSKTQSTLC
ncbi:hypothetical protein V1514DRAFT_331803 [Lipomyces japonicus]|uniref:uncharacterized protein n=1 Tax=Lipomyces japonicus TaxID=56871 RepID=UPI0034CEA73D